MRRWVWLLFIGGGLWACSGAPPASLPDAGLTPTDAGASDAGPADAGEQDAGAADAGLADAGPADAGEPDAGDADAGDADAGPADAGEADAGPADAGELDAGSTDAGEPDAGDVDAGEVDAGGADAGELDAGDVDAGEVDAGDADAGDADAGPVDADAGEPDAGELDAGSFTVVTLVAGNLTSANGQSYDPGPGLRIFRGLHPDVAMIQEFNYGSNSDADLRSMVDQGFGADYGYVRGAPGQQIPNGVVSRYPILQSGAWVDPRVSNRDFVWAELQLPGGQKLWAISVHLLTSSGTNRNLEAQAIVQQIQAVVPPEDLVAVAGDFNTETRGESCIGTFSSYVGQDSPYPADQDGNDNTNGPRNKPHDWVLVSPQLRAWEVPLQLGANGFPAGLVFDSRVYAPLIDVSPVQAGDSGVNGMQHMAVERAFAIPN
jgi:endonuclease/exonuclease/phosphatase family metal-dependent hydrolase